MWSTILDWAFHWVLLYLAFELGRRWNEKDVAASIAAITETQSRRRSSEFDTPEKVPPSPSLKVVLIVGQTKSEYESNIIRESVVKREKTTFETVVKCVEYGYRDGNEWGVEAFVYGGFGMFARGVADCRLRRRRE
jgi:hypothetical protein